jgi:mitofusin
VRAQHTERASDFLVKELKVVSLEQINERVFFISAKEVLQARLQEQKGLPLQCKYYNIRLHLVDFINKSNKLISIVFLLGLAGAIAEGFSMRYLEFQDFERKFEACISKSAVQTKFEQHSHRGKHIVSETKEIMSQLFSSAQKLRSEKVMFRKELWDKIDFTDKQLQLLTHEMKDKIRQMVEDVECKVSKALNEEIRRLAVLVDEFCAPFHSDNLVLNVYKKELHRHVEKGLGSNMRARLSTVLALNMENSQKEMTERMSALVPAEKRGLTATLLPRREPFEVLYRLNCDNLCGDFQEDISFKFSFGLQALMKRMLGRNQYGFFGGGGLTTSSGQVGYI